MQQFIKNIMSADTYRPLSDLMRPTTIDNILGQSVLANDSGFIRNMIKNNNLSNLILWGPPGCGKTTLARAIANSIKEMDFILLSAVFSGIPDIKKAIEIAKQNKSVNKNTILFIDEIHRFNKTQQDTLLPYMEDGTIIFIGATTENPSFNLNNALLSRCHVTILDALSINDLLELENRAEIYTNKKLPLDTDGRIYIANISNGDARFLLNNLEFLFNANFDKILSLTELENLIQKRSPISDKHGDTHYNLISAVHKSLRSSDTDAALYWTARMMIAGQDPNYIFRRLTRFAIEDIGLADPNAMQIALNAWNTYERLGSPEGDLALTELVIYLGAAPKSVANYKAKQTAYNLAEQTSNLMPPKNILNAPTKLMKQLGYNNEYIYDPDTESGCSGQNCFPEALKRTKIYKPIERGFEREIKKRIEYWDSFRKNNPS